MQYCTVKYTKAQPFVQDAHMWQCTPDLWANLTCLDTQTHLCIFESSQFEGSCVRDLGFACDLALKNLAAMQEGSGLIPELGKEMATHSNILVWEVPWTKEPGGPQSLGLKKRWTLLRKLNNINNKAGDLLYQHIPHVHSVNSHVGKMYCLCIWAPSYTSSIEKSRR